MQRLILAEKGVATNQCCAVFPWTEFCNSIRPTADLGAGLSAQPVLVTLCVKLIQIGAKVVRHGR